MVNLVLTYQEVMYDVYVCIQITVKIGSFCTENDGIPKTKKEEIKSNNNKLLLTMIDKT